ncbi:hypothetical protein PFLA_a3787 [Pseudoalteromonas flavipulchra NCIMB 2033 = ATCC BAA-314]|nr:hypothetical protein [Pseudoalteromonas flavipulchra NCIMB 2033 = ATCC BAA-314]
MLSAAQSQLTIHKLPAAKRGNQYVMQTLFYLPKEYTPKLKYSQIMLI